MVSSTIETFIDQLRVVRILLSRELVQQQVISFFIVLTLAWLLSRLLQRGVSHPLVIEQGRLRELPYLYWPLLGLGLGWISAEIILKSRLPSLNLYYSLFSLLWTLLVYRLLVALLYTRLSEQQAQRYYRWLLTPLFLFFLLTGLIRLVIGSIVTVQAIPLITVGTYTLTVGILAALLLTIYTTIVCSWLLQDILYRLIEPNIEGDPGIVHSINTIGRYTVIAIGILFALRAVGLDLTSFAIIGGGLSVGIGFGLQQIVANFFAGIILVFEQALRPGDIVKLDEEIGVVEKLNIRSTVIRTYDNVEVIVPNERFLTSKLVSYTKSDRTVRLSLPVGAGYDSDPEQVQQILLKAAQSHPSVLRKPNPIVFFKGFGDSSIDFTLMVWLQDPRDMPRVRSDLNFSIWKYFAEYKIEIPFPQHDLNLRRGWGQVAFSAEKQSPNKQNGLSDENTQPVNSAS
ncbi:MAG: mechanosensitive ion channel family protein [Candidatus Promineifilaceae bacterium]